MLRCFPNYISLHVCHLTVNFVTHSQIARLEEDIEKQNLQDLCSFVCDRAWLIARALVWVADLTSPRMFIILR